MIHSYDKTYLDGAMEALGAMMDFSVRFCGNEPQMVMERFIAEGLSARFAAGNPKYVAGMSGVEIAKRIFREDFDSSGYTVYPGADYWCGWILAYFQWNTGWSFNYIVHNGLDMDTILSLYPTLHEADPQKFLEIGIARMMAAGDTSSSRLKRTRKNSRLTQDELAVLSGVPARTIQAYEQGVLELEKAEAATVLRLSNALGCSVRDLLLP